jgi:hypothetical protein
MRKLWEQLAKEEGVQLESLDRPMCSMNKKNYGGIYEEFEPEDEDELQRQAEEEGFVVPSVKSGSKPFSVEALSKMRDLYEKLLCFGGTETQGFEETMEVEWAEWADRDGVEMGVDSVREG